MNYIQKINSWIEKNQEYILDNLSQLVQINTENLPPTGNEKPGQEFLYNVISKFMLEKDIDIFEVDEVKEIRENPLFFTKIDGIERQYKNRPNMVAKIQGNGNGKSLAFSGHMDIVLVREKKWPTFKNPYSGKIKEGKMYGRGTADMKAGTFCGFMALKCLKDLNIKLAGDIYAESVVDEEYGGVNGTIACRLRYPDIDFAILSEPTDLNVVIETRGGSIWKASVDEGGPGGYSQTENPVYKLSKIIDGLGEYNNYMKKNVAYPKDYKGEKKIELLIFEVYAGGKNYIENASYIPKKGHIYFYLPTLAYQNEKAVRKDFTGFMNKKMGKYDQYKNSLPKFETILRWLGAHHTDTSHIAMSSIKAAYKGLGLKYQEKAVSYPCDAFAFKEVSGTEVVVIGPVGSNFHGIDEYVEIDSVLNLIKIMTLSAINYCG